MTISYLIQNFRNFMITSWPCLSNLFYELDWDKFPYFIDDWIQANWEFLVEQQILEDNQFLHPYGGLSSSNCRITNKNVEMTHQVFCMQKTQIRDKKYLFLSFVTKDDNGYKVEPPFDYVYVKDIENGRLIVLPFEQLDFFIESLTGFQY